MSGPASVAGLVLAGLRAHPGAPAILCGGRAWSGAELEAYSAAVAERLAGAGARVGDRAAILAERSPRGLGALLGIVRAGCVAVPLDPALPEPVRGMLLEISGAKVVLSRGGESAGDASVIAFPPEGARGDRAEAAGEGEEGLYVLFTSGSTGRPKGVLMPHRAFANLMRWQASVLPAGPGARVLHFAAPGFDVSFQELFPAWAEGGAVVVAEEEARRDPAALWRLILSERVTRLFLPVVALRGLAGALGAVDAAQARVRDIVVAGEVLRLDGPVRALFEALPGCRLHNHYGPTETHVVTAHTLDGDPRDWPSLPPIGRPIEGAAIRLEADSGAEPPEGEPGEIVVSGLPVATGYVGEAAESGGRFIEREGLAAYRTGDLARWNSAGVLEYLGRLDRQVKIRGVRVEPAEVELAMAACPGVAEAAAEPVVRGGETVLAGFYAAGPEEREMRGFLAGRLVAQAVPGLLVRVGEMPLTASGKIDRMRLVAGLAVGVRAEERGGVEGEVAAIWAEVLGCAAPGSDVGFFEAGGTSLGAARMQGLILERLGREIAVADLFRYPTIRALAAHLGGEKPGAGLAGSVAARVGRMRRAMGVGG